MLGLVASDSNQNGFLETGVTVQRARSAIEELLEPYEKKISESVNVPFSVRANAVMKAALQVRTSQKHVNIAFSDGRGNGCALCVERAFADRSHAPR